MNVGLPLLRVLEENRFKFAMFNVLINLSFFIYIFLFFVVMFFCFHGVRNRYIDDNDEEVV